MEQQDLNLEEKVVEMVDLTAETANQELQTLEAVSAWSGLVGLGDSGRGGSGEIRNGRECSGVAGRGKSVLVCCVSVGSRKVRLGKFGQGG